MNTEQQFVKANNPDESSQHLFVEEQFRLMANSAPVLIWIAGIDKLCYFFNNVWLKFTGRSLEQEAGNGWIEGVHPDDHERCMKIYVESFNRREEFKMEYRLKRNDGQYRWILDNGVPNYLSNGNFAGFIGSCVDIHEIKEVDERKNYFIDAASHELKTPVTSLKVYLHLLEESFNKGVDEKANTYVAGAISQVDKITNLINQLLDVSKINSGGLNFEWTVLKFFNLLTEIVRKTQNVSSTHVIEIKGSCDNLIQADQERLSQAIENLLTNAIKYSPAHNKITVILSEDKNSVKASVIDYGIGIGKDHIEKVFEKFYRVPGQKEQTFPGMGIGLFLTKQIIEKHGGEIWVESKKDTQTSFHFIIPVFNETN